MSNSIRIVEVRVRAVEAPMPRPHRTASGVIDIAPLVLTDIVTDAGVVGHSMVFSYFTLALKPLAALTQNLDRLLIGEELVPQQIAAKLAANFRLLGPQGLVGIAVSAIDMAVWDALARHKEMSLARLLGAAPRPLRVYSNLGYDGAVECARQAEAFAKAGRRGVKAKIGYATVEEDLEVLRSVRSAVGPDLAVMADYNQSLSITEALERCRRLDGEGLTWIEEPVRADEYQQLARITAATQTPIQSGENWWGPNDLMKAVAAGSTDYVMPDIIKIGGVTGWRQVAAIAELHSKLVSNHIFPEVSAQLMTATPTAGWLEYEDWFQSVVLDPIQAPDGYVQVGDNPGSGLEWDESAVERYRVL